MVEHLNELLQTKKIGDISFVLAENNSIVSDALEQKYYSGITGLSSLYDQITSQGEHSEEVWQNYYHQFLILSRCLNDKIKELKQGLKCLSIDLPRINGQIYNRHWNVLSTIYSDLIYRNSISVN